MPQGQGLGWDFCWDFAQPSQVVRGGAAVPDATKGLPPARAYNDCRAGSASSFFLKKGDEWTFDCDPAHHSACLTALVTSELADCALSLRPWPDTQGYPYRFFQGDGPA